MTIGPDAELTRWFAGFGGPKASVMLVTKVEGAGAVNCTALRDAALAHGWTVGQRFKLSAHRLGHVMSRG